MTEFAMWCCEAGPRRMLVSEIGVLIAYLRNTSCVVPTNGCEVVVASVVGR